MNDLGTLRGGGFGAAIGINDPGQVVGYATIKSGQYHAFLYDHGVMTDLGTLPGGGSSFANNINASGQVVGQSQTANGNTHAFCMITA